MINDHLGAEFKAHEAEYRQVLPLKTYAVVRVDGRAFHTYTRGMGRPFDAGFAAAMVAAAAALCEQVSGAVLAYTQSDEISIVLTDRSKLETQPWLGGVVAKIISLTASIATAEFNARIEGGPHVRATFDSRVFTVSGEAEALRYLHWRQVDARRNALNQVCDAYLGKRVTRGVGSADRRLMLANKGVDMAPYERYERGMLIRSDRVIGDVEYVDKRSGTTCVAKGVERRVWTAVIAPLFKDHQTLETL